MTLIKKKIAIIIGQLSYGGAEKQISLLAKGLKQSSKYEPVIFCLSHNDIPYGDLLKKNNVTVHYPPGNCKNYIRKLYWLVKEIKHENCKLLYGILHVGNVYSGLCASILRLPYICSIRSSTTSFILGRISAFFCQRANWVIPNSNACDEALRNYLKIRHSRNSIILNAVETGLDVKSNKRVDWKISPATVLVGTVALLKQEKRPEFFVEIAEIIHQEYDTQIEFVWVGDGIKRNEVFHLLSKDKKNYIHFPGASSDIPSCLAAFNVFVLTSAYEGMSNSLLEAMAVGLPCVVTDVPGNRELIVSSQAGLLVDSNSPEDFARTIVELINDAKQMQVMKQNGKKYVQDNFLVKKMTTQHIRIFDKVLQNNGLVGK